MSIPRECKRLIEVDFPIAAVSRHSAREKSIRRGHPSTLHLWWARRPLAACRAVLMGLLLPDPADPRCPNEFKEEARRLLAGIQGEGPKSDLDLRRALLDFIAEFADWDHSAEEPYITRARALVKAAHPEETPLVVDPFAGGGSIPLEALRLGCEAFASDLNPVACLILKVVLEDIPRYGSKLAGELRRVGAETKAAAEKELAEFFPSDQDGARPIAYLWARTVRCESPNCGTEIPLVRSFWLSKKAGRPRALRWKVERPNKGSPEIAFEVFEPKKEKEVPNGTVTRAKASCLACGAVVPPERVRAQLATRRGGADVEFDDKGNRIGGARLLAVVVLKEREVGRRYRLATERDYGAVRNAMTRLEKVEKGTLPNGLSAVPDEPTPAGGGSGAGRAFSVQKYGMLKWGDLFTARQKLALAIIARIMNSKTQSAMDTAIGLSIGKLADFNSSLSRWAIPRETSAATFGRQALPIIWDFCETVPIGDSTGSLPSAFSYIISVVDQVEMIAEVPGQVQCADACASPLPDSTSSVWFTDPPYYDAVPYADLADFFYVWHKRALPTNRIPRDPFDSLNPLTPKTREIVEDEVKTSGSQPKDRAFFAEAMRRAFSEGRRVLQEDGVGAIVFAHKSTEGWESLLSAIIEGGWTITASWPVATERPGRLRSQGSAALSASVHLVCRPRPTDAPIGGWEEILQELPRRILDWVERLSGEGIRGADLVFSCIGPAMELYSRHPKVETADGLQVKLDEFLAKVWEVLGRTALRQVLGGEGKAGEATGGLEEDARLTALFLWTLQSTSTDGNWEFRAEAGEGEDREVGDQDEEDEGRKGLVSRGYSLPFDIVRRFAQPLGIHLGDWEGRVIETDKGVVRLLPISAGAARLFGGETAEAVAAGAQKLRRGPVQATLFPESEPSKGTTEDGQRLKKPTKIPAPREMTTLDRVHGAMLLQTAGQSGALREFLEDEVLRGPQFLRLANALSALYPKESEEKRLLDAVLLAMPRR